MMGQSVRFTDDDDARVSPGQPAEPVEDPPVAGTVKPEDYPEKDRVRSRPA